MLYAMNTHWTYAGLDWTTMGMMQGVILLEKSRTGAYNSFCIPATIIVLELMSTNLSPSVYFQIAFGRLTLGAVFQFWLKKRGDNVQNSIVLPTGFTV